MKAKLKDKINYNGKVMEVIEVRKLSKQYRLKDEENEIHALTEKYLIYNKDTFIIPA